MRLIAALAAAMLVAAPSLAKLPPLSDEAKAKAAEAAAKTAHNGKVDAYKLCQSMERVAVKYIADAKKAGKEVTPTATPPCADPGPFAAAGAAPPAAPAAAAPAPAAAAKPAPAPPQKKS